MRDDRHDIDWWAVAIALTAAVVFWWMIRQ